MQFEKITAVYSVGHVDLTTLYAQRSETFNIEVDSTYKLQLFFKETGNFQRIKPIYVETYPKVSQRKLKYGVKV
jgi:hypothetical protein